VLERTGSWEVLEELARSNLFVVPLDAAGEQYRYHHLFADLLRVELRRREPELEAELHRRASTFFESRGLLRLAVEHARLGGDVARAAALAWAVAPVYLGTGRAATLERWLAPFTPEDYRAHPALAIAAAWSGVSTRAKSTRPINEWIGIARMAPPEAKLPDGTPVAAAVALLEAVAGEHGLERMASSAAAAVAADRADSFFRPTAMYLEGSALLLLGRHEAARDRLEAAVDSPFVVPGTGSAALAQLALLAAGSGSWGEAEHLMERAVALVDEHHLREQVPQALVFAVLALVEAHRGDADAARRASQHSRRLLSLLDHFAAWLAIEARVVLARVELLLGEVEAARVLGHEARDLMYRLPVAGLLPERIDELFMAIGSGAQAVSELSAAPLTTAELRVLAYLPTHLSFQAMAEDLYVSRNTVKTQAISIYRKLGVSSRGDAVARARELSLLEA
jgi:LuxR family maltose regulon positive regulatory protein